MLTTLLGPGDFKDKLMTVVSSPAVLQSLGAAAGVAIDATKVAAFVERANGLLQFGKTVSTDQLTPGALELAAQSLGVKLPDGVASVIVERIPNYAEEGTKLTDFVFGGGLARMVVDAAYPDRPSNAIQQVGRCPNCNNLVFPSAMQTHKCPHCKSLNL